MEGDKNIRVMSHVNGDLKVISHMAYIYMHTYIHTYIHTTNRGMNGGIGT